MLVWFALGCGGSVPLEKPHDPPAWPLENLHTRRPPEVLPSPVAPPTDAGGSDSDPPPPAPSAPAAQPEVE